MTTAATTDPDPVTGTTTGPTTEPVTDPTTEAAIEPATEPDPEPVSAPDAPAGALAALARGHLTSARQALGPRLDPGADETTRLTLGGHTLSLAELLRPAGPGTAFNGDTARPATGLSWLDATGRCASWTTAACGESALPGRDGTAHHPNAGPWDTLLYNLATGLIGGGLDTALWQGSEFTLALGGPDADGHGGGRRWTLWGRGQVQAVAGLPAGSDVDASLRTGYLGLDTALGANGRVGLALSQGQGRSALRTVHPYLAWSDGTTTLSALGGIGRSRAGDDRSWTPHAPDRGVSDTRPLSLRMGRVDVQRPVGSWGGLHLDLRADAAWAGLTRGEGPDTQLETVRTLRVGVDAGGTLSPVAGLTLTPSLQGHLRHDAGDGPGGRGLELGFALGAARGALHLNVKGRLLTTHSDTAYRERGLETTLAIGQPGSEGPSLSLTGRWGDAATGGDTLWQEQLHYRHETPRNHAWSLDARTELGLRLPGGALLSGSFNLSHAGDGPRALLGLRLAP